MWPRTVEAMIACWLAMSPFIFEHPPEAIGLWINDFACATLLLTFALASFWRPWRRAHLLSLAVTFWMLGFGYLRSGYPAPPSDQNLLVVGLLLLITVIIPSEADVPPLEWQQFLAARNT